MAAFTLKDFPEDAWRQLKIQAAERGITLRALVIETLTNQANHPASQPIRKGKNRIKE